MVKKYLFLAVIIFAVSLFSGVSQVKAQAFDYELYQKFLDSVVMQKKKIEGFALNVVDYTLINKGKNSFGSLYRKVLSMLEFFNPDTLKTKEDKIAFWINTYNIGAIKIIIDHYPVDSIRSRKINWLKNPWEKAIIKIGGREYSLSEIEHDILLKNLNEPKAHFAIVCASLSCPDLSGKVYRSGTLKEQLKAQARAFLSNTKKGLEIDRKKGIVYFSQIFKFDGKTFPNGAKDASFLIVPFIGKDDGKYIAAGKYKIKKMLNRRI